jgi:DNA-binding NarL/FixJ family response regulator
LTILLGESGRFTVCAQTDAASTARELFEYHRPDLVVAGLTLRGGDGIGLIKDFRKLHPAARTLVISKRDDALAVQRAFRAGARAYLMADDDTQEILLALDRILVGELYASESVGRRLLEKFSDNGKKSADFEARIPERSGASGLFVIRARLWRDPARGRVAFEREDD